MHVHTCLYVRIHTSCLAIQQREKSAPSDGSLNKSSMVLVDGDVEEPVCNEADDLLSDAVDESFTDGGSPVNVDPPTKETLIDKLYKITLTSKTKPDEVFLHQEKNILRTAKVEIIFFSICAKLYNFQVVHILQCEHSKLCAGFLKAFDKVCVFVHVYQ